MTAARERRDVRVPVLAVSAVAWAVLVAVPPGWTLPAFCAGAAAGWRLPSADDVILAVAVNPPGKLAAAWVVMLAAMMGPVLVAPLCHLRGGSLASRRGRSTVLFLAGYAAAWSVAGIGFAATALALRLSEPVAMQGMAMQGMAMQGTAIPGLPAPGQALALTLLIALVWQASPAKQSCLNRYHDRPALSALGFAADRDAGWFGLVHGMWCIGSCWPLMLAMLLLPDGHLAAMAVLSGWLVVERLGPAVPPGWRWLPWRAGPALRLAAARAAPAWSRIARRAAWPARHDAASHPASWTRGPVP